MSMSMSSPHAPWQHAATEGVKEFFMRSGSCSILDGGASSSQKLAVRREHVDEDGRCPAHYAALSSKSVELLRAFLSSDGRPGALVILSMSDESGWTPLHCAVSAGRLENAAVILALLVSDGPDGVGGGTDEGTSDAYAGSLLLKTTENGGAPIHYAASKGHEDVLRALLSVGEDMKLKQLRAKDKR